MEVLNLICAFFIIGWIYRVHKSRIDNDANVYPHVIKLLSCLFLLLICEVVFRESLDRIYFYIGFVVLILMLITMKLFLWEEPQNLKEKRISKEREKHTEIFKKKICYLQELEKSLRDIRDIRFYQIQKESVLEGWGILQEVLNSLEDPKVEPRLFKITIKDVYAVGLKRSTEKDALFRVMNKVLIEQHTLDDDFKIIAKIQTIQGVTTLMLDRKQ